MREIPLIVFLGSVVIFPGLLQAKPLSVSPEGTFSLNGREGAVAKQFSRKLAGYEKQFYQLTGYSSSDAPPVVLVLHERNDDWKGRISLKVDEMEGNTPRIQVDLSPENVNSATAATTLAQAMLLRQYYNGKSPASGSRIVEFPAWLLHGLGKLSDPEAKLSVIPLSYIRGGTPPSIADLLIQKAPSDSNSVLLDLYDTMAAELLNAGLKYGEGDQALREWIGVFDFDAPNRPPSTWPPGWSMERVERRWLLLMAGNSGEDAGVVALLSVEETLARFDEILGEVPTSNHSLALLKKEKGSAYLIQQLSSRLVALRLRANPLANPLLDETIELCMKLKRLSEKKITEKEKTLASLREEILKKSHAIDVYLDWFEATKLPIKSGLFDMLLKTSDLPIQKGPVGQYLDKVEQRGW